MTNSIRGQEVAAQEHCAADFAEEHGILEADHSGQWRDREGLRCDACASTATDFRLKTTAGTR